jgi:osmotically-inducible protein OsmY
MKIKRLLASFILMLVLATAVFADKQTDADNLIYDNVREKLAGDIVVKGGAIDVDVKLGVVTLSGHVQEPKQKSRAESLAKKVKGVKSVVNNLQIVPQ